MLYKLGLEGANLFSLSPGSKHELNYELQTAPNLVSILHRLKISIVGKEMGSKNAKEQNAINSR